MAIWRRGQMRATNAIHHSDQGSQYTSFAFTRRLQAAGITPSMGSVGDALDNGSQGNTIQFNEVGVFNGNITIGNLARGIVLRSGLGAPFGPAQANEPGVSFNLIGGTAPGTGNNVKSNLAGGIAIFGNPVSGSGQPNGTGSRGAVVEHPSKNTRSRDERWSCSL